MAREEFLKLHWTGKEFHACEHRYVIVQSFEVPTRFLFFPRQITPAPYNSNIDLAIQTLYMS